MPPQSIQSDSRGANQPAPITRPSTRGSTNIPTATGLGERTIKYRPIRATIHDSSISEPNAVATGAIGFFSAMLARKAVWTSQPSAIKPGRHVPADRAADDEPRQLGQQGQSIRPRETEDRQPIDHADTPGMPSPSSAFPPSSPDPIYCKQVRWENPDLDGW